MPHDVTTRRVPAPALIASLATILATCGDPTGPGLQAVGNIVMQADSVVVIASDTARVPVSVTDRRGNAITSPTLDWTIANPAIASVSESGVVRGLRSGRTFVRAERDGARDSARIVVRFDVIIAPGDTHITTIGDVVPLQARARDANGDVTASFVWESRAPLIARVAQDGRVTAVAPGTTWILAAEPGGSLDSARLAVAQRVARISLTPGDTTRPLLRTQRFTARAFDAGDAPIAGVRFTWRSTTPSIATVDTAGLATAVGEGVDTIVAIADGVSARAVLRVSRLPRLFFNYDTIMLGAGQAPIGYYRPLPSVSAEAVEPEQSVAVTIDVSDANVVAAPSVVDVPVRNSSHRAFSIAGRNAGTARIVARAAQHDSAVALVRVTSPRLVVQAIRPVIPPGGPLRLAMNEDLSVFAVTSDSLGTTGTVTTATWIRAVPVTAGIVRPTSDTLPVAVGQAGALAGFLPLAPGRTWVRFESPGYLPDSAEIEVVPARLQFTHPNLDPMAESSVGVGQGNVWHSVLISLDRGLGNDTVVVTLQQAHPEVLRLSVTQFRIRTSLNSSYEWVPWVGLGVGVDTIIASAAGYAPDTMIVRVTRPHLRLAEVPSTVYTTATTGLRLYVTDSLGNIHYPVNPPVRLRVSSSDPRVLAVDGDTALIGDSNWGGEYRWTPTDTGVATLTFTDPTGAYVPVTSPPITVAASRIWFGYGRDNAAALDVGVGQHFGGSNAFVKVDNFGFAEVPVHIESRNPRVARPDPVDPAVAQSTSASAIFNIHGGDTTGTSWFVFSGPGLRSDSMLVRVGRPMIVVTGPQSMYVRDSLHIQISLRDHAGNTRFTREATTFRLTSTDTTVLIPAAATVTVPAGGYESPPLRVRALGTGIASVRVEDIRTGYNRYADGATPIITVKSRS